MDEAEDNASEGCWYVRAVSDISVGSFAGEEEAAERTTERDAGPRQDTGGGGAKAQQQTQQLASSMKGGGDGGPVGPSPKLRGMHISWAPDYDDAAAHPHPGDDPVDGDDGAPPEPEPLASASSDSSSRRTPPPAPAPAVVVNPPPKRLGDPADRAYARTMTTVSDCQSVGTAGTADVTESEEDSEEDESGGAAAGGTTRAGAGAKSEIWEAVSREGWHSQNLCVVVIGASGDLAKKKTYPSLLSLFAGGLLPSSAAIWGYARSSKTSEEFREHLRPYLMKLAKSSKGGGNGNVRKKTVEEFLERCHYHSGRSYGDVPSYEALVEHLRRHEANYPELGVRNRLFYLAVPPDVFGDTAAAVRSTAMEHETAAEDDGPADGGSGSRGWVRLVVEKPFGRDLPSCLSLSLELSAQFDERHLYRIDHYLGKEMVQNLLTFRFGNDWMGHLWHGGAIRSMAVEFKEPFGTEGRGGYFDKYGIIRDVIQNHLLQVLTLLAMEPPEGEEEEEEEDGDVDPAEDAGGGASGSSFSSSSAERVRDAKVAVLRSIPPVTLDDVVLGQYEGYAEDPTIADKGTNCPTYAAVRLRVNTPRWEGVPFLLTAGKALDERLCQVRVRFRPPPGFAGSKKSKSCGPSELVLRLQPGEHISLTARLKTPGYSSSPLRSSLSLDYASSPSLDMSAPDSSPDAYTRLLLDVLRGNRAPFVRDDELVRSWEIFTPLLHAIEREGVRPAMYEMGSEGPEEARRFLARARGEKDDDEEINGNYGRGSGGKEREGGVWPEAAGKGVSGLPSQCAL